MPGAYWILIVVICVLAVLLKRSYDKAHDRAEDLQTGKERIKGEFRSQDGELREYQSMCQDLMSSNERLKTAIARQDLTPEQREDLELAGVTDAKNGAKAEHLKLVSGMRYPEGRQYKDMFALGSFVSDLQAKSVRTDIQAVLLCIDSGIMMRFLADYDPMLSRTFITVILQIPEGGTCCIYQDGVSDPEEDWPPVRACVDTMFAHDKEVYLSYQPAPEEEIAISA